MGAQLVFDAAAVVDASGALRQAAGGLSTSVDVSANGCGSQAVERAAADLALRATLDLQQFQGQVVDLVERAAAAADGIDAADAELAQAAS